VDRRTFIRTAAIGSLAVSGCSKSDSNLDEITSADGDPIEASQSGKDIAVNEKTHLLTLSFDDGFKDSFFKVAEIYESFGLKASLNVIASAHLPSYKAVDDYILPKLMGNFDDWNALKDRGHEIMPHSWAHKNLAKLPLDEATGRIDQCLDYFEEHLISYEPAEAVFNFPFNASNSKLEQHALKRVRAVRSGGETAVNKIPDSSDPVRLSCWCYGRPTNCDDWIEKQVQQFLKQDGGWLILNLHGLENEGWAPISVKFLTGLMKRLAEVEHASVLPVQAVLKQAAVQS
jgi:peptidoglycan/xylan/chitin deacetylase (PgdA/CDA1 family)